MESKRLVSDGHRYMVTGCARCDIVSEVPFELFFGAGDFDAVLRAPRPGDTRDHRRKVKLDVFAVGGLQGRVMP
ncbi:MAG: Uncharacterised protein [Cellulomonadaceae bacterium TMED98]|nr:MAG: Uncharacterised protein [Cellulomonadaceae bacterium TMED98]